MYKQGDILLIPIPFSDLTSSKKRPVLVLSNYQYNCKTEDIVVAAITSNLQSKDYSIQFTNNDLIEGSLKVTSCIRVDKIYTLSKYIVVKKFGSVKKEIIDKIKIQIGDLLKEEIK
ncbi:type II toxin-antitoxin system PemK/MazF family toxin [Clostridium brassicae]|uniref:Type II toxin-antitoxin system PemK/MazF family toxin n=1 Tax=Clostridium brassicae TaxID=2999072 RepID=A0ABT4DB65_9CLOT|nr:type II toxin-antitoxin system PemK/MazF family toxin [Clostridium brassicae]MCY6958461.1 type II toxin-antitoxin system PemK/MazF family toxin [Clostridium brassicae]